MEKRLNILLDLADSEKIIEKFSTMYCKIPNKAYIFVLSIRTNQTMKTLLIVGTLLVGISGQAMSMGHPHNIFAARKQMRAKSSALVQKSKVTSASSCWQPLAAIDKAELSKRLVAALASVRPARSF